MKNEDKQILSFHILEDMLVYGRKYRFFLEHGCPISLRGFLYNHENTPPAMMWGIQIGLNGGLPTYEHICSSELFDSVARSSRDSAIDGQRIFAQRIEKTAYEEEIAKLRTELEVCNRTISSLKKQLDSGYKGYKFAAGGREGSND